MICGASLLRERSLAELHVKTQEEENDHPGQWSDTVGSGQVLEDRTGSEHKEERGLLNA
jgi:hypothetical protein